MKVDLPSDCMPTTTSSGTSNEMLKLREETSCNRNSKGTRQAGGRSWVGGWGKHVLMRNALQIVEELDHDERERKKKRKTSVCARGTRMDGSYLV